MQSFHRLGTGRLFLCSILAIPAAAAQDASRREVAAVELGDESSSFFLGTDPASIPQWVVSIPLQKEEEASGNEIRLWNLPRQEEDTPLTSWRVERAKLVASEDPLAPGFALFVQTQGIKSVHLFSRSDRGDFFVPAGPLPWIETNELRNEEETTAPPPPLPDFAALFDEQTAKTLDAMYRVASSGDAEAHRIFINLFFHLPIEAQNWLANFVSLTLQDPSSPYSSLANFAASAYASYTQGLAPSQANTPNQGAFFFAPAIEPALHPRLANSLAMESLNGQKNSDAPQTLAVSVSSGEGESEDFGQSELVTRFAASREFSLAQRIAPREESSQGQDATPSRASRIGIQEATNRQVQAARRGASHAGENRFLSLFFPANQDQKPFFFSGTEKNRREKTPRESEKHFAIFQKRRQIQAARRT